MRARRTTEYRGGLGLALGLLCSLGCQAEGFGGAWPEPEWLTLRTPQLYVPPADDVEVQLAPGVRAHPLNDTVGWGYLSAQETATQLNTWSRRSLERLSPLIAEARSSDAREIEGGRAWGPFDDPQGRDLQWRVFVPDLELDVAAGVQAPSEGHVPVELQVRAPDDDDEAFRSFLVFTPTPAVSEGETSVLAHAGTVRIEAGLVARWPELGHHLHDTLRRYEGAVQWRYAYLGSAEADALATAREVWVEFDRFAAVDMGLDDGSYRALEPVHFASDARGGQFRFDRIAAFDDLGFTGPELDRMQVELAWGPDESGRAQVRFDDPDPWWSAGDPAAGTLVIDECFDAAGGLVWRDLSAAYLELQPDYRLGEIADCVVRDFGPG